MALAPANVVKKMTDAEYDRYYFSLTDAEADRECNRRYLITEYEVRIIDEYGDAIDCNAWDTLKEAQADFARADDDAAAVVLEKARKWYRGGDRSLDDTEYTVLQTRGSDAALEAGGWKE